MLGVHTNIQQIGKSVAIFAKSAKISPALPTADAIVRTKY